jgi:hypothetical protein
VNATAKLASNPTRTASVYGRACWFKVACGIVVTAFLSIKMITDEYASTVFEEYYPDTSGQRHR